MCLIVVLFKFCKEFYYLYWLLLESVLRVLGHTQQLSGAIPKALCSEVAFGACQVLNLC